MNYKKLIIALLWIGVVLFFLYQKGYILADFESVYSDKAIHMVDDVNVTLLDVRTPQEYAQQHIRGAILIPLSELNSRLHELNKDKTVLIYCQTGNRSVTASRKLTSEGYTVFNLSGGITSWSDRSLLQ
ncbi:MAG: rhodanese-like domain-containing protein [Sulfurimonadaceae bacterium]|nr:rhodanese-like domain-containing protein [Sulfurimonadaceae bacterium]